MFRLHIQPFGREIGCAPEESVLAAALRAGVYLPYGCRTGGCGSCRMRLVAGEVTAGGRAPALSAAEHDDGWFLPCVSRPLEDCVIEADPSLSEGQFLAGDRAAVFVTELLRNEIESADVRAVRLRLLEPEAIRFVAGQFVNVEIPGSTEVRSYSIASPPSRTGAIDLYVKRRPDGLFSGLLEREPPLGTRLRLFGPFGRLRIRLSHRPIIMAASGTGLAPLLAMLSDLAEKPAPRPVRLFVSARAPEDVIARDRIAALAQALPGFAFVEGPLDERLGSAVDHDAYLCGPPRFIEASLEVLLAHGVRRRNVLFDVFTPARG
jgi:NAD(P)H-flavin reductase/ferredoxin